MKEKILLSSVVIFMMSSASMAASTNQQLLKRIQVLENKESKLKIGADYRFSIDNLKYEMASGKKVTNDALYTNRLWLMAHYKQDKHLEFKTKLAFNKAFGNVNTNNQAMFDQFDWFGSTKNTDNQLRVKEAYINYRDSSLFGFAVPWKFGIGRRPTSYGKLLNLRDDENEDSPLGHIVSAEFDGGSMSLYLQKQTGIDGFSVKLAAGRGASNIMPSVSSTPNADNGDNINMFAMNMVTYATKNIHTELQILRATNLIDITSAGYDMFGNYNPNNADYSMNTVGDITLASYMAQYTLKGTYDTKLFASIAYSKTSPDSGESMLGSQDSKSGTSIWLGAQTESPITNGGHWGVEYNHGSKYFRSFTYAEDTVVGSKLATRGDAYEFYMTEQLTKGLSAQLRYTYIDYDYTGSNGFFGSQTGAPMKISDIPATISMADSIVKTAQDFRVYLKYTF
jgi:hypothetical protein